MEATAIINYNPQEKIFTAFSDSLTSYDIEGVGETVEESVEDFIYHIQDNIEYSEKYGHIEGQPNDKNLYNLKLNFETNCNLSEDDRLYITAVNMMLERHHGQKDKAGHDYYFHPLRVSFKCDEINEKIVALLHDTVEDTGLTLPQLVKVGFDNMAIINGIVAVTRRPNETYAQFIERAYMDDIGREVKIHDLEDNMDITRLTDLKEKDWHRLNKYLHSWRFLNNLEEDSSNIKE